MTQVNGKPKRKLLIVEDAPDVVGFLVELLADPAVEIGVAEDGIEAVSRARSWRPDAILLDIRLPGMDGFEVFRVLRKEPGLQGCKIVLGSAQADTGAMALARDLGAFAWTRKPYDEERLRELVHHALGLVEAPASASLGAPASQSTAARADGPGRPVAAAPDILLLVAPDADADDLKRRFEDNANVRIVRADDVEEALRLGRVPLVRGVVVSRPFGGQDFRSFFELLRARGVRAPVIQLTSGAPDHPQAIALPPLFRAEELDRALSSLRSSARDQRPAAAAANTSQRAGK